MPTQVAPGITYWSRPEIGLPPSKAAQTTRKTIYIQHYSTGQELGREDFREWWGQIYYYHVKTRGYDDIGYNVGFANDRDPERGHVLEGRGWLGIGAHTKGYNTPGFGGCFLGNDDPGTADATPGALRAIKWSYEEASRRNTNELERKVHRDLGQTACPGDELAAFVHGGFHVANFPTSSPASPGWEMARAVAFDPEVPGRGYLLDGWGGVHSLGGAPKITDNPWWPGFDIARDIAFYEWGPIPRGYLLDGYGGVHALNGAPEVAGTSYWEGFDIAKRLVVIGPGSGYVMDGYGGVHPFGGAPWDPTGAPYWGPRE